jgi:hypothetical protein
MTAEMTGQVVCLYQNRVINPKPGLCVASSCKATILYGKHGYCRKLSHCEDICPAYIRKALCHCSLSFNNFIASKPLRYANAGIKWIMDEGSNSPQKVKKQRNEWEARSIGRSKSICFFTLYEYRCRGVWHVIENFEKDAEGSKKGTSSAHIGVGCHFLKARKGSHQMFDEGRVSAHRRLEEAH